MIITHGNRELVTNSLPTSSKFLQTIKSKIQIQNKRQNNGLKLYLIQSLFFFYRHLNRIADNKIPVITKSKFDNKTAR